MNPIDGAGGNSYINTNQVSLEGTESTEKATGQTELKQEDFLSLLTKQLSYQDPFKPVENDQMIAQMASFATVNGIGEMRDLFTVLSEAMASNQALQASSLVGKNVLVPSNEGFKDALGTVTGVVELPQMIKNLVVRVQDSAGDLVRTFSVGEMTAGNQTIVWDGLDDSGNQLTEGLYRLSASGQVDDEVQDFPFATYANVNSVILGQQNGGIMLNIAGLSSPINLADVREIGTDGATTENTNQADNNDDVTEG